MVLPNLNALRLFAAVAQAGSFRQAADQVGLTAGAVSQRMAALERDLGAVLFTRHARGVVLTEQGTRLAGAVVPALDSIARAAAAVRAPEGQVVLHLGSSFAAKWLAPRLAGFAAQHGAVSLVTEIHDQPLTRPLGPREVAIWPATEPRVPPGAALLTLAEGALVAVAQKGSAAVPDVEALLRMTLLQDANRGWERLIAARAPGLRARILNFGRSASAMEAAALGQGVALVPVYLAQAECNAGRLGVVWRGAQDMAVPLHIAWAQDHARDPALRAVLGWVSGEFGAAT